MKKKIRYWSSHPDRTASYWRNWFCLSSEYDFIFDSQNPQYLFVTEYIYTLPERFLEFCRLNNGTRVSIFLAGEAISPDMNLFDYGCCCDKGLVCRDRIIRMPPTLFFKDHIYSQMTNKCFHPKDVLMKKNGFCNFIYSNPHAHPRRDQIFHLLNSYKKVDALGSHLNNCGNRTSRGDNNWGRLLVEMKRPYKFSIAAENACFDGYVTEKLISSFQAQTIPIYWGSISVVDEFNPSAFINANGLDDNDLLNIVKKIDQDEDLWCEMLSNAPMTESQNIKLSEENLKVRSFFEKVFDDRPLHEKKRAPVGYWNSRYRRVVPGFPISDWVRTVIRSLIHC